MSVLMTVAHAVGANGYVQAADGNQITFSNELEKIYRVPGKVEDPPGSGKLRQMYFISQDSADVAAKVTHSAKGTSVVDCYPGA